MFTISGVHVEAEALEVPRAGELRLTGVVMKLAAATVTVVPGEVVMLASGWLDLQQMGDDVVFLCPMKYEKLGLAQHALTPIGDAIGPTGIAVKLIVIKGK